MPVGIKARNGLGPMGMYDAMCLSSLGLSATYQGGTSADGWNPAPPFNILGLRV